MGQTSGYYDGTDSGLVPTTKRRGAGKFDRPTADELWIGLRHVRYEITQLSALAMEPVGYETVVGKALVEARLLHARNLVEFLGTEVKDRRKDSILSFDFEIGTRAVGIDPGYVERLNKDLAHLTYSRTSRSAEDFRWPRERVYCPVLERCLEFTRHVLAKGSEWGAGEDQSTWRDLESSIVTALAALRGGTPIAGQDSNER